MTCPLCAGVGWVCENHPNKPWADDVPNGCTCGAGAPCRLCNAPGQPDVSRVIQTIDRVDDPDRIGPVLQPVEALRTALTMIRETVETLGPPGALPEAKWTDMNAIEEAEAICRAILVIAERAR